MFHSSAFRFTSAFGGQLRAGLEPMSDEALRRAAPSVFATEAHESRSERYAYIPTHDVLGALRREGFLVFGAAQARTRLADRREHTKHLLRLRHLSTLSSVDARADSVPEIVLLNSHDGSSSYQMMAGVFRYVCANGLIVPDGVCQQLRVQHSGRAAEQVVSGAFEILDGLTRVVESRDDMRALTLDADEQRAFAAAAAQLRWEPAEGAAAPVTPEQVNQPRRPADVGADLWTSFNRVQENLLRGGMRARTATGARQRTRAVTGIDQDVRLNRALWTLAEEMRRIKGAH